MGRWGTRTYVNCYFTHIICVSLLCLSPLGQLCLVYMHLYSCFILHLHCNNSKSVLFERSNLLLSKSFFSIKSFTEITIFPCKFHKISKNMIYNLAFSTNKFQLVCWQMSLSENFCSTIFRLNKK